MTVRLRLSRHGTTNAPFYWLVAADSRFARDGRFLEKLGIYDPKLPHENVGRLNVNKDRVAYWLSVGAQPSDRMCKLLSMADIACTGRVVNRKKSTVGKDKTTRNPEKRRSATVAATGGAEVAGETAAAQ